MSDERELTEAEAKWVQWLQTLEPTRKEVDRYRALRRIESYDVAKAQMWRERIGCAVRTLQPKALDLSQSDPENRLATVVRAQYMGRGA